MEKLIVVTRVVIAIALAAIALNLWMQPDPVSRKDFIELREMSDRGVSQDEIFTRRQALNNRIPFVYVQGGSVSVD